MSLARVEAMVNQSRRPGECSLKVCAEIDRRIGDLHAEMEPYEREIRELQQLREKATNPKCSLIKPLVPPRDDLEPVAVFDGDGFSFYWCDEQDEEMIEFDEWPIDCEYTWASDLEELGFRVELC